MPTEHDLFAEEQTMATMSFGEHIEELRVRLILALLGLFVGVIVVFLPPLDIGWRVMKSMEAPAKVELDKFYRAEYQKKREQADAQNRSRRRFKPRFPRTCSLPSSPRSPPICTFPTRQRLRDEA